MVMQLEFLVELVFLVVVFKKFLQVINNLGLKVLC